MAACDQRSGRSPGVGGEAGYALIGVLVVGALLLTLGAFGSRSARTEIMIARNELLAERALAVAEAGVEHGVSLMRIDGDGVADELTSGGAGGSLDGVGAVVSFRGGQYRFRSFGGSRSDDGYYVRVLDNYDEVAGANNPATDADSVVYLESLGRIGSAERSVKVALRSTGGASSGPGCGIMVNGDLMVSGVAQLTGIRGCAHANRNVTISGDTIFATGVTATNQMNISGNPTAEGTHLNTSKLKDDYEASHDMQPERAIPPVRPFKFGSDGVNLAEAVQKAGGYRLDSNCRVYNTATAWTCTESPPNCTGGNVVANLSTGANWNGWECSSDSSGVPGSLWKVGGSSAGNGAYFVEGWVNISGNPGTSGSRWQATLVALNTIDISGNPNMAPFTTSGDLRNLLLVSGNDLGLGGNLGASDRPGGVLAHQQIKNNGNFALNGFLLSENGKSTWAGDPAPFPTSGKEILSVHYELSGNPSITYSGLDVAGFPADPANIQKLTWVEQRGS